MTDGEPRADECTCADHVGRLHHDPVRDVWYECVFEERRNVYTWAAVPPNE